mgnify:CR=1 FL=1
MMTRLADIASVLPVYPFRKKVEPEEGGDVAVIQVRDVDVGNAGLNLLKGAIWLRNDSSKYDRYLLNPGDLLFQSRGSRHPVVVVACGLNAIAASGLHVIRPIQGRAVPEYLAWWFNHPVSQGKLAKDVARGTYIPFISKKDLEGFLVPMPVAEVQMRIVEVDRLRRRERELREGLDTLTQQLVDNATLTAAVRNNLRRQNK